MKNPIYPDKYGPVRSWTTPVLGGKYRGMARTLISISHKHILTQPGSTLSQDLGRQINPS
jgi:hypothetical protein